jgi:hypothetical protein
VNAAGEGRLFDTAREAMAWVRQRQEAGVASIDVGCLQINLRWHPDAFQSLDEGFTPALNADYAARFLRGLYEQTGDWRVAAGSYHSFTPELRDTYLASLEQNLTLPMNVGRPSRLLPGPCRGRRRTSDRSHRRLRRFRVGSGRRPCRMAPVRAGAGYIAERTFNPSCRVSAMPPEEWTG